MLSYLMYPEQLLYLRGLKEQEVLWMLLYLLLEENKCTLKLYFRAFKSQVKNKYEK